MPHLTLEYSSNLASNSQALGLLKQLHQTVGNTETVDIEKVKSRAVQHHTYLVGAKPEQKAFLFLRLEILPGRTPEWKHALGEKLHGMMKAQVGKWISPPVTCSTNVEVRELDGEFYFTTAPA